jgi:hypothetical protein
MANKPYDRAESAWLRDNEELIRKILHGADAHRLSLHALAEERRTSGAHALLQFAGIDGRDLAIAMSVCQKLIEALGPTAQAMRDELHDRETRPRQRGSLPIV